MRGFPREASQLPDHQDRGLALHWFFTAVFTFGPGTHPISTLMGPYSDQQACEARRIEVVEQMSAVKPTICTRMKGHPKAEGH